MVFSSNSIPNILKHRSFYKELYNLDRLKFLAAKAITDIFQNMEIIRSQSMNQF